jgi:hypothetical protein
MNKINVILLVCILVIGNGFIMYELGNEDLTSNTIVVVTIFIVGIGGSLVLIYLIANEVLRKYDIQTDNNPRGV